MKKKGLSGTALKSLAIIAMTVDHIALVFFSAGTAPYYVMRLFGRLAAPIMTFMLVEGFLHTRSRKKYFRRLMLFAAISQPIYFLFMFGRPPVNALEYLTHWNIMFTLAVALLVLMLFDYTKLPEVPSLILLGTLISLSHFGDWSYVIPAWAIIFRCCKSDFRKMCLFYAATSVALQTLVFIRQFESFAEFSFQYGMLFALIPISMYNGQRGNVWNENLNRWFFYLYYPAHMAGVMLIGGLFTFG